jgi:phosphoserine phosphatase
MNITPEDGHNFLADSGFIVAQPDLVYEKIEQIRADGPENLTVYFDWDYTVIDNSTWRIIRSCLPEQVQRDLAGFVAQNITKLDDGTMTPGESLAFTSKMLDALRNPDLPSDTLAKIRVAMASTPLFEGAQDVFNRCEQAGAETIVGSAAIADFIGITATANGIAPSRIIATPLRFNMGRIASWVEDGLTHDLNKHTVLHSRLAAETTARANEIVIGDRPHDTLMARSDDALFIQVGGIGTDNFKTLGESFAPKNEEHRPFDLVAIEPGLVAVDGLLRHILS